MKLLSLFSAKAARKDLSDALGLGPEQRVELEADPDKFIDDNFGDEGCGQTRAMLGGGPSTWDSFKSATPMEIGIFTVIVLSVVAFIAIACTPR